MILARARAAFRRALLAARGKGSLEDHLLLLGLLGGGVFLVLVTALFMVQHGLDGTQRRLAEVALPAAERIASLETGFVRAFRRQGQISTTVDLAQLEALRDRRLVEGPLRLAERDITANLRELARSARLDAELADLPIHIDVFLATDAALFSAMERRHTLQALFEKELAAANEDLAALVEGSQAVFGMLRLDYVLFLRDLAESVRRGGLRPQLIRAAVFGHARSARQLTTDLANEMLTFGRLILKLALASTRDAVNSLAANELPQSRARIERLFASVDALLQPGSDARARAAALGQRFAELAPRVMDERLPNSLVSVRRQVIGEAARAASVRAESQQAALRAEGDTVFLEQQVAALAQSSIRGAALMRTTARVFSIAVVLAGLFGCLMAARRIGQGIVGLRARNRALTDLKEDLTALNASLDARVAERTRELSAANGRLEDSLRRHDETQRELITASRLAGMADVATGVLHNVGNVLNSINVSASVVADRVRQSKVASVGKVSDLLSSHQHDLGTFLTADDRGRRLPEFLRRLAETLTAEQRGIVAELGGLQANIDHIKMVIALQQTNAKTSALREKIDLSELVDEAVRMGLVSQELAHGVSVERDLCGPIALTADRHKVSQILVNVLNNATQAVRDHDGPEKRITVRTRVQGGDVVVAVQDTGCGIAPENLARIFNHGFTTKVDGHGFGLHSAACAAGEMGGKLEVHSAGPGTGATFTLTLPLAQPRPRHEGLSQPAARV